MKLKKGDLVTCIEGFDYCNGPELGQTYTIISIDYDDNMIGVKVPKCTYNYKVRNGTEPNWGLRCFKPYKTKNSEIEFLDSIQYNFKDGV